MVYTQRIWLVVCFLLCEILTGSHSSRVRRQAPDGSEDPSLQGLGSLLGQLPAQDLTGSAMDLARLMDSVSRTVGQGAQGPTGVGQGMGQSVRQGLDLSSVMEMANALQQNPGSGVRFQLNSERGSDDGMVEVLVETQSLDDLTRSEAGRRQLGQLNAQLQQAMGSLRQGVQMMQSVPQAQQALTSPDLQTMLGNIAMLFSSGGFAGNDSMNQLLQTVDQLPALKGLLQNVQRVLTGLESSQPSTARDLQHLLASLTSSLQAVVGEGGAGSLQGADSVQRMMQMAVSGLRDGAELLNTALYVTHNAMGDAAVLQALNSTRCLLTSLTDPQPDTRLALHCMQSLLHTAVSTHDSEQILATITDSLGAFLNDPQLLQAAMSLLQSPSLDTAFSVMQAVMAQVQVADTDITTAMQTAQAMLRELLQNQQLLQALGSLLQSPESAALYGEVMETLRNATLGDPLKQQLLLVVNDTLVRVWAAGDIRQAANTLRQVIAVLSQTHDPDMSLSDSQRAFLDLLHTLLDMMVNATDTTTTRPDATTTQDTHTPTPTTTTTTRPASVTVRETTVSQSSAPTTKTTTTTTTPQPATTPSPVQTTSTTRPESSSPAPATTRRSDTVDDEGDNGGAHVSFSAVSVAVAVFVSAVFV